MEPESITTDRATPNPEPGQAGPRASEWLWCPWYAKLWWAAIGLYWAGRLASFWIGFLAELYATAAAGWLNIAFYPIIALLALGMGFIRAWMEHRGWAWGPPTDDQLFPRRSVGGWRDPYSDPLDPRSGPLHWRHFYGRK